MVKKRKPIILVVGACGQLGTCLRDISSFYAGYEFLFTDIDTLDVTDKSSLESFVTEKVADWIVNASGYTAVDKAETEIEKAVQLNVSAVENLAGVAKKINAGFIHISSDYVFDGAMPEPIDEDADAHPLSVYGRTKHDGDKKALEYERSIVLRTSWLYSEYGHNFVKTIRSLALKQDSVSVVGDQWGTPTSAHDLAKAIMTVIEKPKYGLFNFSNEGLTSWALFAEEIISQSHYKCKVNHIKTSEYPSVARRPEYSILNKKKFAKTFKVDIPEWEASLEEVIHRLEDMEMDNNHSSCECAHCHHDHKGE